MKAESTCKELEPGTNVMKRGRWYGLDTHEIAVTETTIRGFVVEVRPRIDTEATKDVE